MGFLNDILSEIMAVAQENFKDKVRQLIEQEKFRKKLNNMEDKLDNFLEENYGNEEYYDSLYRYIHNGKVSQGSNDISSVFYYTLLCAFLNSDDNFLGETRFSEYHWDKIQKIYPNYKYNKKDIKKCFLHYYNTFKEEFGCLSDNSRVPVNSIKETVIENSDTIIKVLANESDSIKGTLKEEFVKIFSNAEGTIQSENVNSSLNQICDDNNEYQEKLNDPLFLESDSDDGKTATLANVYIEPHFKFDFHNLKEWAENRNSRILLLYGKAGVGKTSYTSWLSINNDFPQVCHILELRKYIQILDSKNPWESIKKSFKCINDDEYQNKVLILDGLDEVCVLKSDFDGHEFIHNLSNNLRTGIGRSIRIIITSRMGYFTNIKKSNYIDVATIFWNEDSVTNWCNAYCKIHNNRAEWCESFKKTYAKLETDDKRKEVFCTPLILYICCVSQVDISKHDSVASIYDEAFNVIGTRRYNEWTEDSKEEFEINRQFTKELAFQMFLNDKLEDVLGSNFVQIAKEKVVCWVQEKRSYQVKEPEFEKLFAINHFAYDKNNAIEFAHKTIVEYFTAVKLYEDYFENILDGTVENIWYNIFNAFRYKAIPLDIMQYLIDLILKRQNDNWIESFFKAYYIGFESQSIFHARFFKPKYSASSAALMKQIQIAFRNLIWFLTSLGFDNSQFTNTSENLQILASYLHGDINVTGWKNLENINLANSYLANSNFKKVCLKNANFMLTVLNGVDFHEAVLKSVNLRGANLRGANLKGADLTGADLTGTDLTGADLTKANLTEADLRGAYLRSVYFNANLIGAKLMGADLRESDLRDADLRNADLRDADLRKANLIGANLIGADLRKAFLVEAYFTVADLRGADLRGADLRGADLRGADLRGADIVGADLTGANIKDTNFDSESPFS